MSNYHYEYLLRSGRIIRLPWLLWRPLRRRKLESTGRARAKEAS